MTFVIEPAVPSDAPRMASIYFTSFGQNAHSLACWPRTGPVRAWFENMFVEEMADPHASWLKLTDTSIPTGPGQPELIAIAKWIRHQDGQPVDQDLPSWPEGADAAFCEYTFGTWLREHARIMGVRGHWYLEMIGTDPAHQGKGAGTLLMRWGLEQADAKGQEAFLEAAPDALSLYLRHGFEETARMDYMIESQRVQGGKKTPFSEIFMLRQAR